MAKPTNVKLITATEKSVLWDRYSKWIDETQDNYYNVEIVNLHQDEDEEKFYLVITFYFVDARN